MRDKSPDSAKSYSYRLGLVIESALPSSAEPILDKIARVFPGVTFDLMTASSARHPGFRNIFRVTGRVEMLRVLLRLRKRYDLLVVFAAGDGHMRVARAIAVLLFWHRTRIFVFNEFAEGFWLDREHRSNLREHLAMRHAGRTAKLRYLSQWEILVGICVGIILVPLVVVVNVIKSLLRSVIGALLRLWKKIWPGDGRAAQDVITGDHQSMENQLGEISYREGASFGEPDKVMEDVHERNAARRSAFEQLRESESLQGPFLEIGAGVGGTSLLLANEFGLDGVATDISLHSLDATGEVASRSGYTELPLRICCDARWLPFQDGAFGLTFCFQTLHHFADPGPILEEVRRVLSPGGCFYLAEEPVRRWLCLNLYRCDRPENLKGINKWLYETGLLRYVAEAYVGSKEESVWGIMENQTISLGYWRRCLSGFGEVNLDTSRLFTRDAIVFRDLLRFLRVPAKKADYAAAFLFGSELSGLCRLDSSGEPPPMVQDLRKICRCPECQTPLTWEEGSSAHFECEQCGPFPEKNGVHLLFRRAQLDSLYRAPSHSRDAPSDSSSPADDSTDRNQLVQGARIVDIRLLDDRGVQISRVRSGEATVIQVSIECSRALVNPAIGIQVRRDEKGKPSVLYDTNTIWRDQKTGEFSPGEVIEARFCQRMLLGPGSYTITAAIASHDAGELYDWRDDILKFEVEPSARMQGSVNLDSEIEIGKRSTSGQTESEA